MSKLLLTGSTQELAKKIRIHAVNMTHRAQASHIGTVLSMVDILAVLYGKILKIDPQSPDDPNRDRVVLSKGHGGVGIYAVLAETGFFPVELLLTYYQNGSALSGHVSNKNVCGVEISTGSLGHGACVACGMAVAGKQDKREYKVYAIVGDGECNEGCIWEMAMFAYQYKLDNFTVIVDNNNLQGTGKCAQVMDPINLATKWRSFGWNVIEVMDGNEHEQLLDAFLAPANGLPKCIIAHTVKGRGVSFMENTILWHYKDPQNEYYTQAIQELQGDDL